MQKVAKNIMFLGAPGVGKGTYANKIAPILNIPTISTGDLIRHEIKAKTHLGEKIQKYSSKGLLVPDQIMLDMVEKRLKEDDAQEGYLLDGFPRNKPQAIAFEAVSKLNLVVSINLAEWVLLDKIMGRRVCPNCGTGYNVSNIDKGEYKMPPLLPRVPDVCDQCDHVGLSRREDDRKDVILNRIDIYKKETEPLINHYQSQGILTSFDVKKGLGDLQILLKKIQDKLAQ